MDARGEWEKEKEALFRLLRVSYNYNTTPHASKELSVTKLFFKKEKFDQKK